MYIEYHYIKVGMKKPLTNCHYHTSKYERFINLVIIVLLQA